MNRGGKETKGYPRITSFAVQVQTIHTWSDRASNYFVSGEDDMKPGSIPGDTIKFTDFPRAVFHMWPHPMTHQQHDHLLTA